MTNYIDKFLLQEKVAYVVGGLGLVGREITKSFLDAKAQVVVLDINKKEGIRYQRQMQKENQDIVYEYFDISNLKKINSDIDKFLRKYKQIDVWVNCAYPRTRDWGKKVERLTLASWQKNVDTHLNGYSWASRKVCMTMKKEKKGSLINIASIYGVVGSDFTIYEGTSLTSPMAYSAIKGGIVNLTRYLASYFGKYGVRVNSICPGGIFDNQNRKFVKSYSRKTLIKRMASPEEVAAPVLFLASEASSYITGATLMVDGGWTAI